ncbi:ASCH domain-containing protein [Yersinia massiliensis]|uniref:ASCH domain-containing protein n=1 Tax=Yersinia massiliensis TaxID=419257 RepID=UPI0011A88C0F|nr:ASCH domain-containing protein [Yersinia massiliensis]MCB5308564.1 ASCH domain-containing protein [Yersinia massiliensis]
MATIPQKYQDAERWAFGDTEQVADDVLALVLDGTKTATCASLDDEGVPQVGDVFVVVSGRNEPACAVELTDVELKTFDQVDEAHALAEGEGDRTLTYWRKTQQRFFEEYDMFSPDMMLICMRFKLLEKF